MLRLYARFLDEVKNDPWSAAHYMEESEKLDEQQAAAENSALLGGDEGGIDARNSPVCVINAQGIIQMANKMLLTMYGYKRGEIDGKNVSILIPQPFSGRHNTYLRNYLTTGEPRGGRPLSLLCCVLLLSIRSPSRLPLSLPALFHPRPSWVE